MIKICLLAGVRSVFFAVLITFFEVLMALMFRNYSAVEAHRPQPS